MIALRTTTRTARKSHSCNACEYLYNNDLRDFKFTISEMRSIIKAKQNKYRIMKGEKYIDQFLVDGSECWNFKAIPEIHAICVKYDMYGDE